MGTKWQLKVIKADGSVERYLHTKIIGTVNNAMAETGQPDIFVAEELAEVVTFFLYHKQKRRRVTSSEILAIVKAVMTATGYEDAAIALNEHHLERKLKRCRIEVVLVDICELADVRLLVGRGDYDNRCQWDKSRIIGDLVAKYGMCRQTARSIASMVEEKIFNMGITLVPTGLIKQLVLRDAAALLRAEQQFQSV